MSGPAEPRLIYRDNRRLARWVVALLGVQIALDLAGLTSGWMEMQLLEQAGTGSFVSADGFMADAEASDRRQQLIGIAQLGFMILNGILILIWIYRANVSARGLGAELETSPGWAVGWFFIPIANLYMPFDALRDLWKGSANPARWRDEPVPGLLFWSWWLLWLASNITANIAFRWSLNAEDLADFQAVSRLTFASDALSAPASLLFAIIVARIQAMQQDRASALMPPGEAPVLPHSA